MISLLRVIERHHHKFKRPPIGPIGSHLVSGRKLGDCLDFFIFCCIKKIFSVVLKRYSLCLHIVFEYFVACSGSRW